MSQVKTFITVEQLHTLVGFMERHGDLNILNNVIKRRQLWNEIAVILNQIGTGPQKSREQWKKTWSDLKHRTKAKSARIRKAINEGKHIFSDLTDLDKRIIHVLQNKSADNEDIRSDSNEESRNAHEQPESQNFNDTTEPLFVEYLEQLESPLPVEKEENSPPQSPPSPPPAVAITNKRKRRHLQSDNNEDEEVHTRRTSSIINVTQNRSQDAENNGEHQQQYQQLVELKRLELEILRETNNHEREKDRAQIQRESVRVQQQLVTFLEDIKPALIRFLNK